MPRDGGPPTPTRPRSRGSRIEATRAIAELVRLPRLGPRRAKLLHDELGITTLTELRQALQDGRVSRLTGFSDYVIQRLLKAVEIVTSRQV